MKKQSTKFEVVRKNNRYRAISRLSSDGRTFINDYFDSDGGGHESEHGESETKEFFKKYRKQIFTPVVLEVIAEEILDKLDMGTSRDSKRIQKILRENLI